LSEIIVKGDVEGVGRITPIGLAFLWLHLRGEITLDEIKKAAANVSDDGKPQPSEIDATLIANHLNGLSIISEVRNV
jgi:hypothetical protein